MSDASIIVPDIFTTDEVVAGGENYLYLDICDFKLRQSVGMYCLSWERNGHHYGVVAEVIQRLNMGIDVVLNGSLRNLEQARKQFLNLNTVLIRMQGSCFDGIKSQCLIAEDDEVRLEWSDRDDIGHPYVLTLNSENSIEKAVKMLLTLILYDRKSLDQAI